MIKTNDYKTKYRTLLKRYLIVYSIMAVLLLSTSWLIGKNKTLRETIKIYERYINSKTPNPSYYVPESSIIRSV